MNIMPTPFFCSIKLLPNIPAITGKMKAMIVLNIQCEKEPIDEPLARILFGNISDNNTHITAPCEAAKQATNPNKSANKPYPLIKLVINPKPKRPRNNVMPNEPKSNNVLRPTLSIIDIAIRVNIRFVTPNITVCAIAESVVKPAARKISVV